MYVLVVVIAVVDVLSANPVCYYALCILSIPHELVSELKWTIIVACASTRPLRFIPTQFFFLVVQVVISPKNTSASHQDVLAIDVVLVAAVVVVDALDACL